MRKYSFFSLVVILGLSACKDDKISPIVPINEANQLEVRVQPVFGAENIEEDSVYTTSEGYDVKFTDLKFYFTNVKNGANTLVDAALFDWVSKGVQLFKVNAEKANFSSFEGNLGVSASENHLDPSAFGTSNPLNIAIANDMHWDWNPGYIFIKIEAKVDTIPDGIALFDHNVVMHVGKDENMQTFSFDQLNWVTVSNYLSVLNLKLDMQTFLQNAGQNIDLKTEFSTHTAPGQEALSLKVIQNFKAAIKKV